jgi:hypothetical protein|tara:strand:- start:4998 stop:5264 length:267 start_codon:yes stop_codon:yes gene_type:complete
METKEYTKLKKEIICIKKDMNSMSDKIDKIHIALVGDVKFGQDGLVKMVKRHEKALQSLKYMYAKIYGGMIAISTITGVVIKFWNEIF